MHKKAFGLLLIVSLCMWAFTLFLHNDYRWKSLETVAGSDDPLTHVGIGSKTTKKEGKLKVDWESETVQYRGEVYSLYDFIEYLPLIVEDQITGKSE